MNLHSRQMNLLQRIQRHFVGRVLTLAAAIAFSAVISLVLLKLTTRVLHAADYGTYALLMSLVALVAAAMDGGAGLLLPLHYRLASASERGRIFASITAFSVAGASAGGLLICGLWLWRHGVFPDHTTSMVVIALTAAIMPMRVVTSISINTFSVTGRSSAIAAQMALQAVVVFLSTIVALYAFDMGGAALFVGAACGQVAAMGACLFVLNKHNELSLPSRHWFGRAALNAPTTGVAGFIDGSRAFGEGAMLSSAIGLHAVGILNHARLYLNLLMSFSSSVTHNVWGRTLEDARNPRSNFEASRQAWTPVQLAISCAAIFFVFWGKDIVDAISNGKLTEAAGYIPALFIIALIQVTEQPSAAIVYASGRASSATWFRSLMMLGNLVILYPTIALFGVGGIVVVCILEVAAYRLCLRILASRDRQVPFHDEVAIIGCLVIVAAMAYVDLASPPLSIQLGLMIAGVTMLSIVGRRSIGAIVSATRELIAGRPV